MILGFRKNLLYGVIYGWSMEFFYNLEKVFRFLNSTYLEFFFPIRWGIMWSLTPSRIVLFSSASILLCCANYWGYLGVVGILSRKFQATYSCSTTSILSFHKWKLDASLNCSLNMRSWYDILPNYIVKYKSH